MSVRLTGIAIAANEADVVETFVRHNLQYLDSLHVVDKRSSDQTADILARLRGEGLPVFVHADAILDHDHPRVMTALARKIAAEGRTDFIAMLDCDEMITAATPSVFRAAVASLPEGVCGAMPWRTYAPHPTDLADEPCVTRRLAHRRVAEAADYSKAIIPSAVMLDDRVSVSMGNHCAQKGNDSLPERRLADMALAHFPVRSIGQIVSKARLGEWTLRQKLGRGLNEGNSWRDLAAEIRRSIPGDYQELCALASRYVGGQVDAGLMREPLADASYALRYVDLARIDLTDRVTKFSDEFFDRYEREVARNGALVIGRAAWGLFAYPRGENAVSASFERFGEWAPDALALLRALVKPGYCIVDLGCGFGEFSLPLADMTGPAGSVLALDRGQAPLRHCLTNAVLNNKTWLNVHAAPVTERAAVALIPGKTDLLRIAEGWDACDAIHSLGDVLQSAKPYVFVHLDPTDSGQAVVEAFRRQGYRVWRHIEPAFNPQNYFRAPQEEVPGVSDRLALLGVHEALDFAMPGLEEVSVAENGQA